MDGVRRRPSDDDGDAPRQMSDVIDRWLASEGLSELRALGEARSCWVEVVGADVARHASPRSLRDGVLVVAVDHGGWATELRFREEKIVERLALALGTASVRRLDMRIDPSPLA
jgi:predicted nucleic acid-binding Zn ribbon protein